MHGGDGCYNCCNLVLRLGLSDPNTDQSLYRQEDNHVTGLQHRSCSKRDCWRRSDLDLDRFPLVDLQVGHKQDGDQVEPWKSSSL